MTRTIPPVLLCFACAAQAQVSFTPIGDLSGGTFFSRARAVSADGSTVVGVSSSASGNEAFRWTRPGGLVGLGDLPSGGFASDAYAASADGSVIFGSGTNSSNQVVAVRSVQPGMDSLGFIPSGGYQSVAYASSDNGLVACGENLYQGPPNPVPPLPVTQAWRWTPAGMEGLGFLPGAGFLSTACAISADGNVIAGFTLDSSSTYRVFRWTRATGMQDISAGTQTGFGRGISADGSVIVGSLSTTGVSEAFRWTESRGFETLLAGSGFNSSIAADVSADGRRIVGVNSIVNVSNSITACVWDEGAGWNTVKFLLESSGINMTGWNLQQAYAISDDGSVIVGAGTNPTGQTEGWVAVLPRGGCYADFNQDGGVDGADVEAFYRAWENSDPAADVNADGGIDGADVETFFVAWEAGMC